MGLTFSREEKGWILSEVNIEFRCSKCFKDITPPFFYCKQFNKFFCRKCEFGTEKRICRSSEDEHEHFNIIKIVKESK
jgi:hypothetical protein